MLVVTHDQEEALTLGDGIAAMRDGVIQQVGRPHNIYLKPPNLFVGTFIGSPPINRFVRVRGAMNPRPSALKARHRRCRR